MATRSSWIPAGAAVLALAGGAGTLVACRDTPPEHKPAHELPPDPSATGSSRVTEAPPPAPSAAELALLAPLAVGSDLGDGFIVREIHGVSGGVIRLVCVKDKATVRLDIALADAEGAVPPATAGKYAVFYS